MYISFYICIFCFWKANSSLSHLWDLNWQQEGNRKGLPKQDSKICSELAPSLRDDCLDCSFQQDLVTGKPHFLS